MPRQQKKLPPATKTSAASWGSHAHRIFNWPRNCSRQRDQMSQPPLQDKVHLSMHSPSADDSIIFLRYTSTEKSASAKPSLSKPSKLDDRFPLWTVVNNFLRQKHPMKWKVSSLLLVPTMNVSTSVTKVSAFPFQFLEASVINNGVRVFFST